MEIRPPARGGWELSCRSGFDPPAWVTAAGLLVRTDHPVHQHLIEQTAGFARDIERNHAASAC